MYDQNLLVGLQETLDAFPRIEQQTSAGTRCFEDAGGRRKAGLGHAAPIDVDDCTRRAVEGVVIAAVEMTEQLHIGGRTGVRVPTAASQQEGLVRECRRGLEEKLTHALFAIEQSIAEKPSVPV